MPAVEETPERLFIRRELRLIGAIELRDGPLTIGRAPDCDIHLPHEAVSRQHARLERRDGGWRIIDNESVNGVRVNGIRVQDAALHNGDVVEIRPFAINLAGGEGQADQSISLSAPASSPSLIRARRDAGHAVVRQRLLDLYSLARLVIHRKDNGTFWLEIHAMLQRSLRADRCVLVGLGEDAALYRLAPRSRQSEEAGPLALSRSVLSDVINSKEGVMVQRVADDHRYADAHSLLERRTGSVICVPVVVSETTRAVFYAERRESAVPFTEDDLAFVVAAMDMAVAAVEVDELQARATELSRVRGRLDAAREFQEMLLPAPIPQPDWGEVAAVNMPADQMSGDIYDILIDDAGRLSACIVDVSGKGVPAAFVSAILHHALRSALLESESLEAVVRRVNGTLDSYHLPACFATMVLCRWSADGRQVEIANAGHHAPLWVSATGAVEAYPDRVGLPLGILPEWSGEIVVRDVSDDRILLLSSDGATEARNPQKEEIGLERLGEHLGNLADLDAGDIVSDLLTCIRRHAASMDLDDDVTLVLIRRTGQSRL